MPDLITEIDFLADLPLYKTEKPYYVFWAADDTLPQPIPSTNLELERHSNVCLTDLRGRESDYTVESHGFEIFPHTTQIPMPITDGATMGDYKRETECMLSKRFNAIAAYCYETRVRKNDKVEKSVLDLRDPVVVEKPAAGVHVDATAESGPMIAQRHLPDEYKELLTPHRRMRIVNTWRSMNPVVQDRPLAVIDYWSVNRNDLLAADRVTPFIAGEIYYLKFNPDLRWYWLSEMTDKEPMLMLTYDTMPGNGARYGAHVSVENSLAPHGAAPRHSVETRTILISDA